jgi:hypothetical protein
MKDITITLKVMEATADVYEAYGLPKSFIKRDFDSDAG